MDNQTCSTCRYLVELDKDCKVCRRYPPQLFTIDGQAVTLYPMIHKVNDWWCGEWEHKFSKGSN